MRPNMRFSKLGYLGGPWSFGGGSVKTHALKALRGLVVGLALGWLGHSDGYKIVLMAGLAAGTVISFTIRGMDESRLGLAGGICMVAAFLGMVLLWPVADKGSLGALAICSIAGFIVALIIQPSKTRSSRRTG